jgi:hypothetical protein
MATRCPCGCERTIRFGKAKAVRDYERLEAVRQLAAVAVAAIASREGLGVGQPGAVERSLAHMDRLHGLLLGYIHGGSGAGSGPDRRDLAQAVDDAELLGRAAVEQAGPMA